MTIFERRGDLRTEITFLMANNEQYIYTKLFSKKAVFSEKKTKKKKKKRQVSLGKFETTKKQFFATISLGLHF